MSDHSTCPSCGLNREVIYAQFKEFEARNRMLTEALAKPSQLSTQPAIQLNDTESVSFLYDKLDEAKKAMQKICQAGISLRTALLAVVGVEDDADELERLKEALWVMPASAEDRTKLIDAVDALQNTREAFVTLEREGE